MSQNHTQLHRWDVSPKEAVAIQRELASSIIIRPFEGAVTHIAGADISLNLFSDVAFAGIIVLKFPELIPVAHAVVTTQISFPYIPGLLSFREIPALMLAWEKLKNTSTILPEILVVDGQGIAHPRRMGIATHFGLLIDMPTIGCAKSLLYGSTEKELEETPGSIEYLRDSYDSKKIIGALVRTKKKTKPVIISPGYKVSLDQSLDIIKSCVRGYRIPEPTRLAHELVNKFRRGEIKE